MPKTSSYLNNSSSFVRHTPPPTSPQTPPWRSPPYKPKPKKPHTQAIKQLDSAKTAYKKAVNTRVEVFAPLKKRSTRIMNALKATQVSEETIQDAQTIHRKIQAYRSNTPAPSAKTTAEASPKKRSVSQQSFDMQAAHFSELITFLQAHPLYVPNEESLKIATLEALLLTLKQTRSTPKPTAPTSKSSYKETTPFTPLILAWCPWPWRSRNTSNLSLSPRTQTTSSSAR